MKIPLVPGAVTRRLPARGLAVAGAVAAVLVAGAGVSAEAPTHQQAEALTSFQAVATSGPTVDDGLFAASDAAQPDHGGWGTTLALTGSLRSLATGRENAAAAAEAAARAKAKAAAAKAAKERAERAARAARAAARAKLVVVPVRWYKLSARFGEGGGWSAGRHTGLDFRAPVGTPVMAVKQGRVATTAWHPAYGRMIVLDLGGGITAWYCHLSRVDVAPGERVKAGETIGAVGMSGNTSGPHLHFEVRVWDQPFDPADFLWGSDRGERGTPPAWTYGRVQPFDTLGTYRF